MTYVDSNGSGVVETYTASDIIHLFMILAKESMHRKFKHGLKKMIIEIEEIAND